MPPYVPFVRCAAAAAAEGGGGGSGAEEPAGQPVSRADQAFDRASALSASWSGGGSRRAVTSLSSSWNGRSDASFLGRLAHGPHYISDFLDSGDGAGATWPPRGQGLDAWWDSVRRVGVLSVLELERQIGVPTSLVFRRSLGSYGSFGALSDDGTEGGDDHLRGEAAVRDLASGRRSEEEYEMQELRDRRPQSNDLPSFGDGSIGAPTDEASVDEPALTVAAAPAVRPVAVEEPAAAVLAASDLALFEEVFNMHPFAAAAFLRAFIACSFGLILFHVHSVLMWPEVAEEDWVDASARSWLLAQVAVLGLQIPLRMEVQRALFRVSTARDTEDATRRLRCVFLSAAWRANRKFGRVNLCLVGVGPLLLALSGLLWGAELSGVQAQLVSVNSSNLLILSVRALLVVFLLYFVRVAVPLHDTGEALKARGLSEGTISRLRRITYGEAKTPDIDALTQCAVCLEHYEEGDKLLVLPCDRRHNFHAECIEPWLQRMNTCPLCQRGVPEESPD
jgi:hypothetical protein